MADGDEKKTETERYQVEQLIEESRTLLGVGGHVAAGAFHGEERESLTLNQAQQAVKGFLKRPGTKNEEKESS